MWLTLVVAAVSAFFLWREARAVRAGLSSRRQFTLRAVGCALLLVLALVLQFREAILLPVEAGGGARLLRLVQFSMGVFVIIMALLLVALLDARETLRRYLQERKRIVDDLVQRTANTLPSSDNRRDESTS